MPNYENLFNAKKFHLRKMIESVVYSNPENHKEDSILILRFKQKKLFELQMQQKLKISPETIRNCLFFIIESP